MIHKILRLFVNTVTVNDKHYQLNRDNLRQPIQLQLSQKKKKMWWILFGFLKFRLNIKYLPQKDHPHT